MTREEQAAPAAPEINLDTVTKIDYPQLRALAQFILQDKLVEATHQHIAIAQALELPLLKYIDTSNPNNLWSTFYEATLKFLTELKEGTVEEEESKALKQWRNDQLEGFRRNQISGADITLVYSTRKRLLFHFLPHFCQDSEQILKMVGEGESLFAQLELVAYQTYSRIQHEEMIRLNMKLQEYQEELQVINEELRESHEELLITNEDLREQVDKREKAEAVMERERNFLEAILEHISDGIVACDAEGNLSFFNSASTEFHGLAHKQLPPERWADYYQLYQADGKTPLKTEEVPLFRAFKGEKIKDCEFVIAPLTGGRRSLLATGKQIKASDGQVLGAVMAMRDISLEKEARHILNEANQKLDEARRHLEQTNLELERRVQLRTDELAASEEELRQSLENAVELNKTLEERENFLSSIIEQTPVSTWISDQQGNQIRVNEACLNLLGENPSTEKSAPYNLLQDDRLRAQPFYADIEKVFSEGQAASFESEYLFSRQSPAPDVQGAYLKTTIFPIKNAEGKVTNAVVQHEDISKRKRAEIALHESETLFRTIANASPVALWMTDQTGGFIFVNKTWLEWTGQPLKAHMGQGWSNRMLADDRRRLEERFSQSFELRTTLREEFRIRDADSRLRWCLIEGLPRYQADGSFAGYVGSFVDITERKEAEDMLRTKNEELQKINADLDSFIYTASHDLKSPIASIEGLAGILQRKLEGRLNDNERGVMEMIGLSVARFKKTIAGLTDITKVQKDLESEIELLSFHDILTDVKADLEELIGGSQVKLSTNFQEQRVSFTRNNLRSIMYNLLSNALKYRHPSRPLEVELASWEEDQELVLSVRDNGLGIPKEDQAKLFTMFKRLHSHVEGTGIGLYMIKRIVENKGGRITVESAEGEGTCFRVFFPTNG